MELHKSSVVQLTLGAVGSGMTITHTAALSTALITVADHTTALLNNVVATLELIAGSGK